MIVPPALNTGDKIRIVSPAGKVDEKVVLPAARWLENQGYIVELGRHVFARHYQFAGTDKQRREDVQTALDDPETRAVLCSRGGYGTVRIIGALDYSGLIKSPKWLIGFSDITILHTCLNSHEIATIHGVMPRYFFNAEEEPSESLVSLMHLLKGEKPFYSVAPEEDNRQGVVSAELAGGNLSIISTIYGTSCELNTEGKILFLEDIDEFLYHADRMMHQLKLSGKLSHLAGLVVGNFTDMKDNESPFGKNIHEIIADAVREYDYPVCFGFPGGHNEKNLALAFGLPWELNVSDNQSTFRLL